MLTFMYCGQTANNSQICCLEKPCRFDCHTRAACWQCCCCAAAVSQQQHLLICAGLSAICVSHSGDINRLYSVSMAADNTAAWLAEQTHLQLLLFGLPVPPDLNAALTFAGASGGVSCIRLNLPPYQCLLRQGS